MYTISSAIWLSILIEYGFNIYSTREIASGNQEGSIRVIIGTQSAKVLISIALLPVYFILSTQFGIFKNNELWAIFSWLLAIFIGISPIYYFQANEKLKTVAFTELISSGILLISVFGVVKNDENLILLAFLLIFTRFLAILFLTHLMMAETKLRWVKIFNLNIGLEYLKKAFHFFIFQGAISLYTSFNVVLLGMFSLSPIEVGEYASAERLIKAGLGFIGPLSQGIFPRLNKIKAQGGHGLKSIRRYALLAFLFIGFGGMALTLIFSRFITSILFSQDAIEISVILNILSLVIPAIALSNLFGFLHLVVERKEKSFNKIIFVAAIVNLFLSYFMIVNYGARGLAVGWVIIEWMIVGMIFLKIVTDKYSLKSQMGN